MKWHTLTSDGSITTYESGPYHIVQSPIAFGWWRCTCRLEGREIKRFECEKALKLAMEHCDEHSRHARRDAA